MLPPSPTASFETRHFWYAANRGELLYQVCSSCEYVQFYPRMHCVKCGGATLDWRASAGMGVIHSFTIVYRAPTRVFKEIVPYVIALIDMRENFRLMTNVVRSDPNRIRIGMPVRIVFEATENGQLIPQASPA
jgi:uncharacterized OB-fold protein